MNRPQRPHPLPGCETPASKAASEMIEFLAKNPSEAAVPAYRGTLRAQARIIGFGRVPFDL